MTNRKFPTLLVAALCGTGAHAASDFVDTAQVVSSTPIIERVSEPRQECEPAPAQQKSGAGNIVAPILGGVVGGLLGHQIGHGSGQTAATVVGATGGAVAGSVLANRAGANAQAAQTCRTVESVREVVKGYTVVYHYNGRDISTTLPYNPGKTVRVGIGLVEETAPPAAEREHHRRHNASAGGNSGAATANSSYSYRY